MFIRTPDEYKKRWIVDFNMKKNGNTVHTVYCHVCTNPGQSTYQISKDLGLTGGSVRHALSELEDDGLIKFKFDKRNPRLKKLTYPVEAFRLLPKRMQFEVEKFMNARKTRIISRRSKA